MYSPLNIVKLYDRVIRTDQSYTNFNKQFKERYGLTTELLTLIDLISIEDLIAFKLEKSLNLFNGKLGFPLKKVYLNLLEIAYNKVIDSYEDVKYKKEIRKCINGPKHLVGYKAKQEYNRVKALENA